MKEKITTGYSELQILFKELGVEFRDSGPAENNLGKLVYIVVGHSPLNAGVQFLYWIRLNMTITLTVEEIKEYQSKLDKWYAERYGAIMKAQSNFGFATNNMGMDEFISRWDREHPLPSLLSRV
jgi:hypothetical protein